MVRATSSTFGQAAWSAPGIAWRFAAVSRIEGDRVDQDVVLATSSASATVSAATAALLAV